MKPGSENSIVEGQRGLDAQFTESRTSEEDKTLILQAKVEGHWAKAFLPPCDGGVSLNDKVDAIREHLASGYFS